MNQHHAAALAKFASTAILPLVFVSDDGAVRIRFQEGGVAKLRAGTRRSSHSLFCLAVWGSLHLDGQPVLCTLRRPVLDKLLRNLKRGDTLVVYKLDRIARSLKHLLTIIERLQERGAAFESLTEHIDTNTPAGRLMLRMLGAFAEFEREMIRERTTSGMQAAKKRGARLGRPRSLEVDEERQVVRQWRSGGYTLTALAHQYGVHLSSIKRAVYRASEAAQPSLLPT